MLKSVTDICSLRNIRSMHTTGQRTIPKSEGSAYLNLFMLRKEKEKLEKEKGVAEKRIAGIDKRLADIQKETDELQKLTEQEKVKQVNKGPVIEDKKWKRMPLNY